MVYILNQSNSPIFLARVVIHIYNSHNKSRIPQKNKRNPQEIKHIESPTYLPVFDINSLIICSKRITEHGILNTPRCPCPYCCSAKSSSASMHGSLSIFTGTKILWPCSSSSPSTRIIGMYPFGTFPVSPPVAQAYHGVATALAHFVFDPNLAI